MENPDEQLDLLPPEEALTRLYLIAASLGCNPDALDATATVARRHRAKYGHALSWGCCAVDAATVDELYDAGA